MREIVFVFPFAGGSSQSFLSWKKITSYQFVFIDMPGKGNRDSEPFLHHFTEMVEEGFTQIARYIKSNGLTSYCIWGHSMGSYLSYEIVKKLSKEAILKPRCLIMSASVPKKCVDYEYVKNIIDKQQQFLDYIVDFGLVSKKVANSCFFQKKFLPQMKLDYEVMLEYIKNKENSSILCKQRVIILNGEEDEFLKEDVEKWEDCFDQRPEFKWFPGGHFFIFEHVKMVFQELDKILKKSEDG